MASLFKRLYQLLSNKDRNQLEDYLTEIFAEVLLTDGLLQDFLRKLASIEVGELQIREATTQKTYAKQEEHHTDSRPDVMIRFSAGGKPHVLFIENKLGTYEGELQLKRYADHLRGYEAEGCLTHLIYVTQLHDPKRRQDIVGAGSGTTFRQVRWYQIYNWLKPHGGELIRLLRTYMEEMRLNDSRKFVPQDMYAIQHMERLIRMMDACLDGKVEDIVSRLFSRSTGWTNRFVQLKDSYRYMKQNDQGNFTTVLIGFYLTDGDYPSVCIMFEVNPKCPKRAEVIAAMRAFAEEREGWSAEDLEDKTGWSSISCERSLLEFLSTEDHVEAIQTYFAERLQELHAIKRDHPELEWK